MLARLSSQETAKKMEELGPSDEACQMSISPGGVECRIFLSIQLLLGSRYPERGNISRPPLQPGKSM